MFIFIGKSKIMVAKDKTIIQEQNCFLIERDPAAWAEEDFTHTSSKWVAMNHVCDSLA